MQKISSTLASFKLPNLTPEEWVENDRLVSEWEAEQEAKKRAERFLRSGIPRLFGAADVSLCDEKVAAYASGDLGNGLLLQGTFGAGKTYAACAVLNRLIDSRSVRFILMDNLLRECKATFNGYETEEAVVGRYANVGVLCIDDLGKERLTEWSLPILFSIINRRYEASKPTIITTNYRGADLLESMTVNGDATTARAIISRMSTFERIVLEEGDRRIEKGAVANG